MLFYFITISKFENSTRNIKKLKWKWTGYMMRSTTGKWTKVATEWYPRFGKRTRGGPREMWKPLG